MAATSALNGSADEMVIVRLSDVPQEIRVRVADRLERAWTKEGVKGFELLRLRLAAEDAIPDAQLEVPAWKAHRVLVEQKEPQRR